MARSMMAKARNMKKAKARLDFAAPEQGRA